METDKFKTFWQFSKDAALKMLVTGVDGLDDHEAEKRLKEYGSNTIKGDAISNEMLRNIQANS